MDGEVIKSFLVGLGFGVDDSSLAKFNKSIASASLRVAALYGSIKVASTGIAYGISEISKGFEQMGYEFHIIAPAINKAILLRRELLKAYSAAGINIVKVVKDSIALNLSLTKTQYAFEAIYKSVASRFFTLLTKQSDIFRNKLYASLPKIQAILERAINFIFEAFNATVQLGNRLFSIFGRVYDFLIQLDKATDGWSTKILAVVAAWKLLNLGFLATPLGQILALELALLTLWDDFKVFQEGGKTLIDWGSNTTKVITGMAAAIGVLTLGLSGLALAIGLWSAATDVATIANAALNAVLALNPIYRIFLAVSALIGLIVLLDEKWNLFGGHVINFFSGLGGRLLNLAGGLPLNTGIPTTNLGGNTANNNQTNMNLNLQTNTNITGVADAADVGRHVNRENHLLTFDLTRNLKGSMQSGGFIP